MGDSQHNHSGRENEDNHCHDDLIAAQNLTNFSIDEILKPDFGVKKFTVRMGSAFSPLDLKKDESSLSSSPVPGDSSPHPQEKTGKQEGLVWPAWVYCTRYSDRPSSGPRSRKMKKREKVEEAVEDKRPRTAFTNDQLQRLKKEFDDCRYLTEQRRKDLAHSLCLTEAQIKIWFQNKRAKIKKSTGVKNPLALHLMAQGLYNHSTQLDQRQNAMDLTS